MGERIGGNVGVSLNITSELNWERKEVYLEATDHWEDETIPRGKQYWLPEPDAVWYKRTTAIWQAVWLDPADECRLERLRFTGDVDQGRITVDYVCSQATEGGELEMTFSLKGAEVKRIKVSLPGASGSLEADLFQNHIFRQGVHRACWCWTPESSTLFDIQATRRKSGRIRDSVKGCLGLRKIETRGIGSI